MSVNNPKGRNIASFDVTCVVGTVILTDTGDVSPYQAALDCIGHHGAPGSFTFPMEDGRTCFVDVAHGER